LNGRGAGFDSKNEASNTVSFSKDKADGRTAQAWGRVGGSGQLEGECSSREKDVSEGVIQGHKGSVIRDAEVVEIMVSYHVVDQRSKVCQVLSGILEGVAKALLIWWGRALVKQGMTKGRLREY